jgi:hypothetical protein
MSGSPPKTAVSENGLYTVEGWRHFLASLAPDGVFTVSRWYSPDNVDEIGRLLSLAKATLLDMGVPAPQNHLFLASSGHLATLIVGRAPLSRQDVARLRENTARLGFSILVDPDLPAPSPALRAIMDARDATALADLSARFHHDVSPPTDDRPFFFNQLRMTDAQAMLHAIRARSGVISGNFDATLKSIPILIQLEICGIILVLSQCDSLSALFAVQRTKTKAMLVG